MLPTLNHQTELAPALFRGWSATPQVAYGIVGSSPALLHALQRAAQAARSSADVLIEAESGTGKELLSRLIHGESKRAQQPFVAVNCAAIPEHLLESELFGHVRGAFTGALMPQVGKFALAHRGTLLLDEVSELPLTLQPKLLRVLQEREFYRLGDGRPTVVDVRLIATTNRRLREMVADGKFREDLYYRLAVIPLTLPPLRHRGDDVVLLAEHFAVVLADPAPPSEMCDDFVAALRSHPWPGNVRELGNAMRRVVAFSNGRKLDPQALGVAQGYTPAPTLLKPGLSLRDVERSLLELTLQATSGNRTRAAELLGISLRTVRNKIREYGLPPREFA